jgi:hypothetical protein
MLVIKDFFEKKYSIIFLLFVVVSCRKSSAEFNPQDSYKYFPIEIGDYKIFQVVSNTYAVGQKAKIDTVLRKEIVVSKTKDQSTVNYVVERQIKGKNDLFYKPELVYQIITNPKQIVIGERNIYKILLRFPIYQGAKWNINEINGQDEKRAEVVKYDSLPPKLISDKNLVKVEGDSTNNFIDFKVAYSLFSKDVGLIYTENTNVDYCQDSDPNPKTSCTGKYIIESGKREFIRLIEYGNLK